MLVIISVLGNTIIGMRVVVRYALSMLHTAHLSQV